MSTWEADELPAVELCDEGLFGGRGDEGGGGGGPQLCAGLVGGGHIEHCSEEVGDPRVLLNLDLCEGGRGLTREGTAGPNLGLVLGWGEGHTGVCGDSVELIAGLISGGHGEGVSEGRFETGFSVIIIVYHAVTWRSAF